MEQVLKVRLDRAQLGMELLEAARWPDHPAKVPEVALDLASDRRGGVGRKSCALAGVEADPSLEQSDPAHLDQVVPVDASTCVPCGNAVRKAEIQQHHFLLQPAALVDATGSGELGQEGLGERMALVEPGFVAAVIGEWGPGISKRRHHDSVQERETRWRRFWTTPVNLD